MSEKKYPTCYDMTFCVSKCRNKCYRHCSQYKFKKRYMISMSNFDCEKRGILKKYENDFRK